MSLRRMLSLVGALLLAGPVVGADKAPNLSDLREAVAVADKKGENVTAIRDALAALEKALAKAATKPNEAPPELATLREAVEMAAKKGENVAAISKELGQIEKALTGREYERPKPPEPPKPEPVPPLRRAGFAGGGIVIRNPGGGFRMSTTIVNGNFTITARQGEVAYEISGTINAADPPKIVIRDGDKKAIETDDPKKVPEEYRDAVDRLLKSITRR